MTRATTAAGALLATMLYSTAAGDDTSEVMVAYVVKDLDSVSTRTWDGSSWSGVTATSDLADESNFVVLANAPTRDEYALAASGPAKDLSLVVHDGTSWGVPTLICDDVELHDQRPFHLAYECRSGDLLVCYWDKTDAALGYRTWDGSTLSPEGAVVPPIDKKMRWIETFPKAGTDEIMVVYVNDDKDTFAALWDGSSWGGITQIGEDSGYNTEQTFSFAWESSSGDGLAVYAVKDQLEPYYRTWDGTTWSGEFLLPSVGKKQRWIRCEADPTSDQVVMAALDDDKDVNVNVWDGSAWGTNVEVCAETQGNNLRQVDVAWTRGGGTAMVVYAKKDEFAPHYVIWDGTSWSSEQAGPTGNDKLRVVQASHSDADGEIFVITDDDDKEINVSLWNGTTLSLTSQVDLEAGGGNESEKFMIAAPPVCGGWRITSWTEVDPDG